jgi:poly-gamma-glutamate system protein
VRQLAARGIEGGDSITASFSGSFPGLNLALMAACQALGIRLYAISSVTASTWGATEPGFTWPEIEALVSRARILQPVSIAVSLGGSRDTAFDLEPDARLVALRIQAAAAADLAAERLASRTLDEAIARRLQLYRWALGPSPPVAHVNIGGNHAALGGARAPLRRDHGWLTDLPPGASPAASVVQAYLSEGVPVLNVLNVAALARAWHVETTR